MKIRIPGKTFLLGEYAVLQGGSAIIACTEPFFELEVTNDAKENNPFHPQSPAGKFIADHIETFSSLALTWTSPYAGGFGGSTAEFLACFKLYAELTKQSFSQEFLYQTYLNYAYNQKGIPPSGADLIAQSQVQEGLVFVQPKRPPIVYSWPFKDLVLLLFKTSIKLPTHEYLQELKQVPDYSSLASLALQGSQALEREESQTFIETINCYADILKDLSLTTNTTITILKNMRESRYFLAAKGCGAMGADVIAGITFVRTEKEAIVCGEQIGLQLIQRVLE